MCDKKIISVIKYRFGNQSGSMEVVHFSDESDDMIIQLAREYLQSYFISQDFSLYIIAKKHYN